MLAVASAVAPSGLVPPLPVEDSLALYSQPQDPVPPDYKEAPAAQQAEGCMVAATSSAAVTAGRSRRAVVYSSEEEEEEGERNHQETMSATTGNSSALVAGCIAASTILADAAGHVGKATTDAAAAVTAVAVTASADSASTAAAASAATPPVAGDQYEALSADEGASSAGEEAAALGFHVRRRKGGRELPRESGPPLSPSASEDTEEGGEPDRIDAFLAQLGKGRFRTHLPTHLYPSLISLPPTRVCICTCIHPSIASHYFTHTPAYIPAYTFLASLIFPSHSSASASSHPSIPLFAF